VHRLIRYCKFRILRSILLKSCAFPNTQRMHLLLYSNNRPAKRGEIINYLSPSPSIAANVRSMFSSLRSSRRTSPSKATRARNFLNRQQPTPACLARVLCDAGLCRQLLAHSQHCNLSNGASETAKNLPSEAPYLVAAGETYAKRAGLALKFFRVKCQRSTRHRAASSRKRVRVLRPPRRRTYLPLPPVPQE